MRRTSYSVTLHYRESPRHQKGVRVMDRIIETVESILYNVVRVISDIMNCVKDNPKAILPTYYVCIVYAAIRALVI